MEGQLFWICCLTGGAAWSNTTCTTGAQHRSLNKNKVCGQIAGHVEQHKQGGIALLEAMNIIWNSIGQRQLRNNNLEYH